MENPNPSNNEQPEMKLSFNKSLKAALDAEGFNEAEQILGTLSAEFKAALAMQAAAPGPMAMAAGLAISLTVAKIMGYACKAASVDVRRVLAASKIIEAAANAEVARREAEHEAGCPDCAAEAEAERRGLEQSGIKIVMGGGLPN